MSVDDSLLFKLRLAINQKQATFAKEYIKSGNARQSAITAGYSPRSATSTGARLVRQPAIRAYMDALVACVEVDEEAIADAQEIQSLLTAIGRGSTSDAYVVPRTGIQFAQTHSRERVKALEVLAKIKGLMVDNVNVSANERIQVINDLPIPKRSSAQKKREE